MAHDLRMYEKFQEFKREEGNEVGEKKRELQEFKDMIIHDLVQREEINMQSLNSEKMSEFPIFGEDQEM